jgi:3D (Asp-Asp-Asp) domain-containing protein
VQQVRTTAYTHSEADHLQHGRRNALGTTLQYGEVKSAAADWSRWPAGTIFRILETGEIYEVDDYGWALAGTNTIDLYKPSRSAMNQWGVRRVTIEHLVWGDVDRSLAILRERQRFKHVRRMLDQIEERYAELKEPLEPPEQIVEPAQRMVSEPEPEPAPPGPRHTPSVAAVSTRSASSANPSARLVPFQSTTR